MRVAIAIFLACCVAVMGQTFTRTTAFKGAAVPVVTSGGTAWDGYPTNIAGCLGWWSADNGYSTASGLATWLNYSAQVTNISSIDLTNQASGTSAQPTLVNPYINGHAALYFDGGDYLRSVNYYTEQPHEIWLVVKKTNYLAAIKKFIDAGGSTPVSQLYSESGPEIAAAAPTALVGAAGSVVTNDFFTLSVTFTNGTSKIYTNNVELKSGNAGVNAQSGLMVGARYDGAAQFQIMFLAELVTFTNILDATTRSNLNHYLDDKYAITH